MPDAAASCGFAGDLDDPWVAGIADALPPGTARLDCPGELPADWPQGPAPRTLVVHRAFLTARDADRLRRLREGGSTRVVLCVGPHARYHQFEGWLSVVDAVLPEATASETVAHHVPGSRDRTLPARRPAVVVVSGLGELRRLWEEVCRAAGFPTFAAREWSPDLSDGIAVWDVPVLEEGWPRVLARESSRRRVVAMLGFAERAEVTLARDQGAAACLDSGCDLADLRYVLDRLASEDGPR